MAEEDATKLSSSTRREDAQQYRHTKSPTVDRTEMRAPQNNTEPHSSKKLLDNDGGGEVVVALLCRNEARGTVGGRVGVEIVEGRGRCTGVAAGFLMIPKCTKRCILPV